MPLICIPIRHRRGLVCRPDVAWKGLAERIVVVAMSVNCVTAFIAICAATLLRFILVRLNKKLDRGEVVEGAVAYGEGIPGEASKKGFRFVL